jgi:hypothetical protein
MFMLDSGVDITVIALYLGHADVKTTYRYLHHNRRIKEQAMNRTAFPEPNSGLAANDDPAKDENPAPTRKKFLRA